MTTTPTVQPTAPQKVARVERPSLDILGKSEFWLNKVGIALLLLGVAFFFKYSIDRGWLNENVRIGLGLALGTALLGFGLAMHRRRRHFSQVLLGGSIATYYITGFAAYQLLHIVSYELAFGFMAAITALAFIVAIAQNEAILSLIGVAGGLLTPFILTGNAGSAVGLVTYVCLVLAGSVAIYMFKGWRSLLGLSYIGGWAVFAAGYWFSIGTKLFYDSSNPVPDSQDRWVLQAGAVFALLAFWVVPLLRYMLFNRKSDLRPLLDETSQVKGISEIHVLSVATPLLVLGYSALVWANLVSTVQWGWITIGAGAVYGLVAWAARKYLPQLSYTHAMMAVLLFTLGLVRLLSGDVLIVSLAVEAAALHFISRRLSDNGTAIYGHVISGGVGIWLFVRLGDILFAGAGLDASSLSNLAVIVLLAASTFVMLPDAVRTLYRNIIHLVVMGWLFAQLFSSPEWSGWIMLAWAAYAVALQVVYRLLPTYFAADETAFPSHFIFACAALIFAGRIGTGQVGDMAVFNLKTIIDAALVALTIGTGFIVTGRMTAFSYRTAVHAGILALMWRELHTLPDGYSYVMASWAGYGLFVQYLATRLADRREAVTLSLAGAVPFAGVAIWFVQGLSAPAREVAVFNIPALISLACVGVAVIASFLTIPRRSGLVYRLGAYIALLAWFWHELAPLENGSAYVIASWAVCGVLTLYLATRLTDHQEVLSFSVAGAVPFAGVAIWFVQGLFAPARDVAVFNIPALISLGCIGLAVIASRLVIQRRLGVAYVLSAHIALLAWFWHELAPLENGNAFVTIAWGVYAVGLLVAGLMGERHMPVVYAGLSTLLLVIAKLFLVDLAALDPLWRVLLFLGFGGALLVLSYFFQNVIRGQSGSGQPLGSTHRNRFHLPGRGAH